MTVSLLRLTALVLAFGLPLNLMAQQEEPAVPFVLTGPPPTQIAAAHKVFLTSAGSDPNFPIDSTRAYNGVYEHLRAWGHYTLVSSPEQADLVLELRGVSPLTGVYGADGTTSSYTTPAFQLMITDPATGHRIWRITSPVILSGTGKNFDHWLNLSEDNLVSRLQVVAGVPLSQAQSEALTTVPKTHGKVVAIVVVSAFVGLAAGGGLYLHHLSNESLANQKASQDAFCMANHIPLSMCAGG